MRQTTNPFMTPRPFPTPLSPQSQSFKAPQSFSVQAAQPKTASSVQPQHVPLDPEQPQSSVLDDALKALSHQNTLSNNLIKEIENYKDIVAYLEGAGASSRAEIARLHQNADVMTKRLNNSRQACHQERDRRMQVETQVIEEQLRLQKSDLEKKELLAKIEDRDNRIAELEARLVGVRHLINGGNSV